MSLQAIVRMVVLPAGLAFGVIVLLWPLGPAAFALGIAAFLTAQLAMLGRSQRRLEVARQRVAAIRARRRRLRLHG